MKRKYAVFGHLNEFLCDVMAENEQAALAIAKLEHPYASKIVLVCPGNDLGVNSPN